MDIAFIKPKMLCVLDKKTVPARNGPKLFNYALYEIWGAVLRFQIYLARVFSDYSYADEDKPAKQQHNQQKRFPAGEGYAHGALHDKNNKQHQTGEKGGCARSENGAQGLDRE